MERSIENNFNSLVNFALELAELLVEPTERRLTLKPKKLRPEM